MKQTQAEKQDNIWTGDQIKDLASRLSAMSLKLYDDSADKNASQEKVWYEVQDAAAEALSKSFLNENASQKESAESREWEIKTEFKKKLPRPVWPERADFVSMPGISPAIRACVPAGGALYGGLILGTFFNLAFGEGLTGMLIGAVSSAWLFGYSAENKNIQSWLKKTFAVLGAAAVIGAVWNLFSSKKFGVTRRNSWMPRLSHPLLPLAIVLFPWFLTKITRQKQTFNKPLCLERLNTVYLNWLSGVGLAGACFLNQNDGEGHEGTAVSCSAFDGKTAKERRAETEELSAKAQRESKNLAEMANLLLSSNAETDQDRVNLFKKLESKALALGFSRPEKAEKSPSGDNAPRLKWEKRLEKFYVCFDYIEEGDEVEIAAEYSERNGEVVKKGTAVKWKEEEGKDLA